MTLVVPDIIGVGRLCARRCSDVEPAEAELVTALACGIGVTMFGLTCMWDKGAKALA